jgi:serine O-acetyltransferase
MENPINLLNTIREDLTAHRGEWSRPGFQSLAVHRFGNWQKTIKNKALRAPFHVAAKALHVFTRNFYGIELPFEAKIGRRVVFEHQHSIVVHGNATIGNDCILRQGVTLGMRRMSDVGGAPFIEDGVDIGAGASILGCIKIGAGATIGAGAVVVRSVPKGACAVGVPARIV